MSSRLGRRSPAIGRRIRRRCPDASLLCTDASLLCTPAGAHLGILEIQIKTPPTGWSPRTRQNPQPLGAPIKASPRMEIDLRINLESCRSCRAHSKTCARSDHPCIILLSVASLSNFDGSRSRNNSIKFKANIKKRIFPVASMVAYLHVSSNFLINRQQDRTRAGKRPAIRPRATWRRGSISSLDGCAGGSGEVDFPSQPSCRPIPLRFRPPSPGQGPQPRPSRLASAPPSSPMWSITRSAPSSRAGTGV